jgi:drug/metabolite transporter (DMT)-like permease
VRFFPASRVARPAPREPHIPTSNETNQPPPRGAALLVLGLAMVGISFAAPLIRYSTAHPLVIAIWRLAFSLVIVAFFLVPQRGWRQWRRLDRRGIALALGAGVMLALHFWSWNTSLSYTTVAASVVLVNTQPVLIAAVSAFWLREAPTRAQWAGISLAMAGAAAIVLPDLIGGAGIGSPRALLGNTLALAGAATAALYYLTGRRLRGTLDLWPYVALVYGACLITLIVIAVVIGAPMLPQPPREWLIFAALAIGPMMLGHTGMNWALRYLPAFSVNLTTLAEPLGATLLAASLPGIRETPPMATLGGGALVLLGIFIALPRPAEAPARAK